MLKKYDSKVYCGIYSKDGRYFINATQGKLNRLHLSCVILCEKSVHGT